MAYQNAHLFALASRKSALASCARVRAINSRASQHGRHHAAHARLHAPRAAARCAQKWLAGIAWLPARWTRRAPLAPPQASPRFETLLITPRITLAPLPLYVFRTTASAASPQRLRAVADGKRQRTTAHDAKPPRHASAHSQHHNSGDGYGISAHEHMRWMNGRRNGIAASSWHEQRRQSDSSAARWTACSGGSALGNMAGSALIFLYMRRIAHGLLRITRFAYRHSDIYGYRAIARADIARHIECKQTKISRIARHERRHHGMGISIMARSGSRADNNEKNRKISAHAHRAQRASRFRGFLQRGMFMSVDMRG